MAESKTIRVRVRYGISHDGVQYNPGDTFECPAEAYESLKECFETKGGEPTPVADTSNAPDASDREALAKFWDRKKVDEIKAELATRGIEFPDDGKKAELIEILLGPADEEVL